MKRKLTFITVILAYIALAVGIRLAGFNQSGDNLGITKNHPYPQNTVAGFPDPDPPSPPPPPPLDPPG